MPRVFPHSPSKRGLAVIALVLTGAVALAGYYRSQQPSKINCLDPRSAGFSHSAALIRAGGQTSLDVRLVLERAPVQTFNFDIYALIDGRVVAKDLNVRVSCGTPTTRSIALPEVRSEQALSVIYSRSVSDKISEVRGDLSSRTFGRLDPLLLGDTETLQGASRLHQKALKLLQAPQKPTSPTLSRVAAVGENISELPAVLEAKSAGSSFEVLVYNDTAKASSYTVACLQGTEQVKVNGAWNVRFQLPSHTYLQGSGAWQLQPEQASLLHCYSLSNLDSQGKPAVTSPIRPVYLLGQALP
jgi:hypothetical protein